MGVTIEQKQYAKDAESLDTSEPNLAVPGGLARLMGEREKHRGKLFTLACHLTILSFLLLASIVAVQIIGRSNGNPSFEVMDSMSFEVLAVSVFGQIIGIIYIIAKSLWSEKEFDIYVKK